MTILGAALVFIAVASLALAVLAPPLPAARLPHVDASALALVAPSWSVARWEGLRAACAFGGAALLWPVGLWPLGLLAGAAAPSVLLRWREAGLRSVAAARAIDILQGTQAALRSGLPLVGAVRLAIEGAEPLARDPFERALRSFDLNLPLDQALRDASREAGDRSLSLALEALALVAHEQLPAARASTVVASVADRLAFERRLLQEIRARTSGGRAQIVLLALLVPALAAYLVATMPGLAAPLASPRGVFVLVPAAAGVEIVGVLASRHIIRSVW
ncbi:MAG: hypothetical protein AAB295_12600 [Chloroflexota bacterium]